MRLHSVSRTLVVLVILALACTAFAVIQEPWTRWFPLAAFTIPLLLGSMVLGPRVLPWYVVMVMVLLVYAVAQQPAITDVEAASIAVYFVIGLFVLLMAFRRARLGVDSWQGEDMLVDLRDRILGQSGVPEAPPGWKAESALASASGTKFAGDFVVASQPSSHRLEVALVDVSGKGEEAGTRALHLSGAYDGLIGALPGAQFLPAANNYLVRQGWDEGFATAIQLSVDFSTGDFVVRTAGHPPAIRRSCPGGTWQELESSGPALGLMPGATYEPASGRLLQGAAILLYTDGMVERPRRDIEAGVVRLLRAAAAELDRTPDGAASRLVASIGSRDDDRAMIIVRRLAAV